ncbi:TPA: Gfo/Idh/MocA family protein [Streptococcus suis]|nr:Gfo/Idh/MocA family oxidoreductase [Streptococcus suis]HEM3723754.1 Gfo/Idh/MocA family oxidoreductase [Streptococcus suis]
MQIKKLAIVGCGSIFKYAFPAIESHENYQIIGLCDIDIKKIKKFENDFNIYSSYIDMQEDISKDTIILLLVSHSRRKPILEYFLNNGYDVICEKPLFWNLSQMNQFRGDYQELPTVIYHRDFNNLHTLIENFIRINENIIQEVEVIYSEYIGLHTEGEDYKTILDIDGGGCINDNLPNCLSILLSLFGTSISLINVQKNIEDGITLNSEIQLMIKDKIKCIVKLDWYSDIDEKSILIKTANARYYFDLQYNYYPSKDSLYHEYENFFSNYLSGSVDTETTTNIVTEFLNAINTRYK